MQHASCIVALGGDITFTVVKPDVTVPEIALLKAIHGADAVRDINPTFMDKRPHSVERDRLNFEYGHARDHKDEPLISKIFPDWLPCQSLSVTSDSTSTVLSHLRKKSLAVAAPLRHPLTSLLNKNGCWHYPFYPR